MKKGQELSKIPVPYPVDKLGEPIHPYELGYSSEWQKQHERRNNHHLAFYARSFGATAIGIAYRNLEVLQTPLVIDEHTALHQKYSGIKVPNQRVMLDRIHEQHQESGYFKLRSPMGGYVLRMIEDEDLTLLERAYHVGE